MPDGLKIVVGADVREANAAIDRFATDTEQRFRGVGDSATQTFGKNIPRALTVLESAFVNVMKPLSQLEAEMRALQTAIGSTTDLGQLKRFGDQLERLKTQANNLRVVGLGASLNQIDNAAGNAALGIGKIRPQSQQATQAMINLGRVVQDAPYGFLGIANNINPLLESFQRLRASSGSTRVALKSLFSSLVGAGGLGLIVSVASTALLLLTNGFQSFSRKTSEAKQKTDEFKDALKGINSEIAGEVAKVDVLVAFIQKETTSRKERTNAIKELQQIAPQYFATLDAEKATVAELTLAYGRFSAEISRSIQARVLGKQLETIITTRLELEKMTRGDLEQVVIRGKLVKVQNAFYGTEKELKVIQDQINNAKLQELKISQQIASLQPPKGVIKPDVIIKPKKFKQDFFNPLMNLLQRVPFTISGIAALDLDKVKFELLGKKLPPTFREQVEAEIEKGLEGLVVAPKFKVAVVTDKATIAAAQLSADVSSAITEGIKQGATEGFAGIGEAIGTALTGGDIQSVFAGFVNTIGGLLQSIGKQIIAIGVAAILAKEALSVLFENPFVAIAAGVALVAAGAALKGVLNKGVKGFAAGGLVSGPQLALIGEGSGTSRSNPEVVAPLDKLKSMLSGMGGNGKQVVYVRGKLRGNDMILQNARTTRAQGRAGVR